MVDGDPAVIEALRRERNSAAAQVGSLEAEFEAIVESAAFTAVDDEHDPDGATIGFERARVAGLLERARNHLAALDDAVDRASSGRYGVCAICQDLIGSDRLAALPATDRCIACATRST
ncbi:MAG: TraR/DksA family transcriptional regulator [Acidimicrobiales bacterium]|nr:TraR/DksA family transcriptional regulator [Acidimicrobiales bacterium]